LKQDWFSKTADIILSPVSNLETHQVLWHC